MRLLSSPFERFVGEAKTEIRIQGIKKENDIPGTGSAFGQLKCLMKQDNVTIMTIKSTIMTIQTNMIINKSTIMSFQTKMIINKRTIMSIQTKMNNIKSTIMAIQTNMMTNKSTIMTIHT